MSEILGDYRDYITRVEGVLKANGITADEVTQCDMLCFETETNDRYDQIKQALAADTIVLSETIVNGRLISIFQANPSLESTHWKIPYIELLQPKPTRKNREGIDGVFFVTAHSLTAFRQRHADVSFDEKGLMNQFNAYIELKSDGVAIKFHDKHMGSVIELEKAAI